MLAEENKNSGRKLRSNTSDTHVQLDQNGAPTWIKSDPAVEPAADSSSAEYLNLAKAPHQVSSLKLLWMLFSAEEGE